MSLGGSMRRHAAKQAAEQRAQEKQISQIKREGRSLVSNKGLEAPEPAAEVGLKPIMGKTGHREGVEKAISGGRHHGVVANIADSVGYMLAKADHDNPQSTHVGTAYEAMDRAYSHLAMHHSSHLIGNHQAAAGHLQKASEAVSYAMNRIGGSLTGGVENAHGEKHSRPDLQQTLTSTVQHYANHHNVNIGKVSEPEKRPLSQVVMDGGAPLRHGTIRTSTGSSHTIGL